MQHISSIDTVSSGTTEGKAPLSSLACLLSREPECFSTTLNKLLVMVMLICGRTSSVLRIRRGRENREKGERKQREEGEKAETESEQ